MNPEDQARWNDTRVTMGSGNVFADLGFDPAEAEVMALRAQVMIGLGQLTAWRTRATPYRRRVKRV